jgi:hypothetical protein
MNYDDLITTISEIVNNDLIKKEGLTLQYEVGEKTFRRLNEFFFYKLNPPESVLEPSDTFEVEIDNLVVKFLKKPPLV